MFVALCPNPDDAQALAAWASSTYSQHPVRLTPPESLHATLLFYPAVDDEQLAEMRRLIGLERWIALDAQVGTTRGYGRTALGVELKLEADKLGSLAKRLLCGGSSAREFDLNRGRPLGQLVLMQGEPELEKLRRRMWRPEPVRLHITIGRTQSKVPLIDPPLLRVRLTGLALYESHLGPGGSRYEKLAGAIPVGEMPHGYT